MLLLVFIGALLFWQGLKVPGVFHSCFYWEAFDLEALLLLLFLLLRNAGLRNWMEASEILKSQQNHVVTCVREVTFLSDIIWLLKQLEPLFWSLASDSTKPSALFPPGDVRAVVGIQPTSLEKEENGRVTVTE